MDPAALGNEQVLMSVGQGGERSRALPERPCGLLGLLVVLG